MTIADELLNFVKPEAKLETGLDRWVYLLRNLPKMEEIPAALQDPEYEKVFEVAQYSKLSREDKEMYDIELKRRWDKANILATARAEAEAKGMAKGEARGIAKGIAERTAYGLSSCRPLRIGTRSGSRKY